MKERKSDVFLDKKVSISADLRVLSRMVAIEGRATPLNEIEMRLQWIPTEVSKEEIDAQLTDMKENAMSQLPPLDTYSQGPDDLEGRGMTAKKREVH